MNKFSVRCPGCGHFMVDAVVAGFSLLLHPGEKSSPTCLSSIRYVLFTSNQDVCNHCCPETFAQCQVCYRGTPTQQPCRCT
jgi:hypothetical protein